MLPYKAPGLDRLEVSRPSNSQAHFYPVNIPPGQVRQPCCGFSWPLLIPAGQVRVLCSSSAQFYYPPPTPGKQVKRPWTFHPLYTLLSVPDVRDQSLPTLLSSVHFCLSAYSSWMCMLEVSGPPNQFLPPCAYPSWGSRKKDTSSLSTAHHCCCAHAQLSKWGDKTHPQLSHIHHTLWAPWLIKLGEAWSPVPTHVPTMPCELHTLRSDDVLPLMILPKWFYLPIKTQKSDVGVKTCWIREANEQTNDLPFWLETQQEKYLSTHPKPKRQQISKSLPIPSSPPLYLCL